MHSKWVFKHFGFCQNRSVRCCAVLWILGILSGILLCSLCCNRSVYIFRNAIISTPAPVALFLLCALPVGFIAIAPIAPSSIAFLVIFSYAVHHGFCGVAIYLVFGAAAWLLRPLVLFSAGCSSVLMWWLLLHSQSKRKPSGKIFRAVAASCMIFILDFFIISPLIGDLAKYF